MPIDQNSFNSRVTSEALEAKFRQVFPAQGGAELVQDLYASGVVQPVIDFSSVAEGSVLSQNLQTAWDFSTGTATVNSATGAVTIINNTGFWKVDLNLWAELPYDARLFIDDGSSTKTIWFLASNAGAGQQTAVVETEIVVFLRAGDSLKGSYDAISQRMDVVYRQIADVNGNLVNPLGFTFS